MQEDSTGNRKKDSQCAQNDDFEQCEELKGHEGSNDKGHVPIEEAYEAVIVATVSLCRQKPATSGRAAPK